MRGPAGIPGASNALDAYRIFAWPVITAASFDFVFVITKLARKLLASFLYSTLDRLTSRVAAVASDLRHIICNYATTVIAAVFRTFPNRANAYFVLTRSTFSHF